MNVSRVALVLVLIVVMSTIGVGAVSTNEGSMAGASAPPSPNTAVHENGTEPLGTQISMVMQATAGQTGASVHNGMWDAAYVEASDNSTKRTLVVRRAQGLNTTLNELQEERRTLQMEYRNGDINRTEYLARLATIVGELAALSEGIDDASERGQAVGVNETRLNTLRTRARELGGGEVSQIARNLTGDHTPPGRAGIFSNGNQGAANTSNPGQADGKRPGGPPTDRHDGQSAANTTTTPTGTPDDA